MATYSFHSQSEVDNRPLFLDNGDELVFFYSGSKYQIDLPAGDYQLSAFGAQGGTRVSTSPGGKGAYIRGSFSFIYPCTLNIYVGGQGGLAPAARQDAPGGFNGGGTGYSSERATPTGGGGATDFRYGGDTVYDRILVAAGGGGGSDTAGNSPGGYGGYWGGQNGTFSSGRQGNGAAINYAGTINNVSAVSYNKGEYLNGSFGYGGGRSSQYSQGSSYYVNGGGGGWYGGGGATADAAAGGGSSFVWHRNTMTYIPYQFHLPARLWAYEFGGQSDSNEGNGQAKIIVNKTYDNSRIYVKNNGEWIQMRGDI